MVGSGSVLAAFVAVQFPIPSAMFEAPVEREETIGEESVQMRIRESVTQEGNKEMAIKVQFLLVFNVA